MAKSKGKLKPEGETLTQPVLWSESVLPPRDDLVEMVKGGFKHTGKTLMNQNEELCCQVMTALQQGVSGRAIARAYHISRNSINAIRDQMEERGLLEPLKKRISRQLGSIITMGLEDFQDAISNGQLHPSQLPVPMGIFMTHKALVDGDPTARVDLGKPSELSVEAVRAHFEQMKKASATEVPSVTSEAELPVTTPKPQ